MQPPRSSLSNMSDTKTLSFWCLVMMVTKKLEDVHKKLISGQTNAFLGPKRATLGNCPGPNSARTPARARIWPENQIFMHGIVWYCMELLCNLWYRIVFMSFHCIAWYCIVGFGARAVSRKTPIYFIFLSQSKTILLTCVI